MSKIKGSNLKNERYLIEKVLQDNMKKSEEICLPDLPEAAANNTEGCPAFRNMFSHCKKTEIQIIKS